MRLNIEPANGVPIWEQIVRQVKFAVAAGQLLPGELIPSVRDLARECTINPNTVQRAYQQLQSEQVLEPLRGRGMAVCTGARRQCVSDRQSLVRERLEAVVREAIRGGLEPDRLREFFERALAQASARLS